jgi:hypothetical protein
MIKNSIYSYERKGVYRTYNEKLIRYNILCLKEYLPTPDFKREIFLKCSQIYIVIVDLIISKSIN